MDGQQKNSHGPCDKEVSESLTARSQLFDALDSGPVEGAWLRCAAKLFQQDAIRVASS